MKTLNMDVLELAAYNGLRAEKIIKEKYIKSIKDNGLKECAQEFMLMKKPVSDYAYPQLSCWEFYQAPGSGAHHNHFGGLALHTLQNLEYAEAWANIYKQRGIDVNLDILYATIVIHDCMKKFIYHFDKDFYFKKAEDPFIAKSEDHHSWVLRELTQRGCNKELILSVAAIHGIDDVTLDKGVAKTAVVNHYLTIGNTGLEYTADDVRPEHVIAFLSDSDWHWSGQAQDKTANLALKIAETTGLAANSVRVYLGSRFTYEQVGHYIEQNGYGAAATHYMELINFH